MTVDTLLGILIQFCALLLLFAKLGKSWRHNIGAIFIVVAVAYHGLGEILIALSPGYDPYRPLVNPNDVSQFVLLISVAILLFTIAYASVVGKRWEPPADELGAALTVRFFDWKLMAVVTLPLLLLTLGGQGYGSNGAGVGAVSATLGLTQQFFILAIVLTGFGIVMRFGSKWAVWAIVLQSVALALVGERLAIAIGAIMLVYLLSQFGVRLRRLTAIMGLVVLLLFGLAITAARGAEGRFGTTATSSVRLTFVTTGLKNLFASTTRQELAFTIGYRLDGNSYGGMEQEALQGGSSPVGVTPIKNDFLDAIPSFLNPNKDLGNVGNRVEKNYVEEHLPIPELQIGTTGTYLDILPTQLGGLLGEFGMWGMFFGAVLLGFGFAALDRWLRRGLGPSRVLITLGFLYCVLDYEGSWDTYTTTARGVLLLVFLIGGIQLARWLVRSKGGPAAIPQLAERPAHRDRPGARTQ